MLFAIVLALVASMGVILVFFGIFGSAETFSVINKDIKYSLSSTQATQFDTIFSRQNLRVHFPLALIAGLIFGFGTGWPVAGIFGAFVGWVTPDVASGFTKGRRLVQEVEAWEEWAGQLLNLVLSGNGVSNAIVASARYSPELIRDIIEETAHEVEIIGFNPAIDNFVKRSQSPYSDQLALGLRVAYESGSKISNVFSDILDALRNEVEIIKRAEAARKVANTQGLLSIGISLLLVMMIILINRGYLEPFDEFVGQVILGVVAVLFSAAILTIRRFSIVLGRPRLLEEEAASEPDAAKLETDLESEQL